MALRSSFANASTRSAQRLRRMGFVAQQHFKPERLRHRHRIEVVGVTVAVNPDGVEPIASKLRAQPIVHWRKERDFVVAAERWQKPMINSSKQVDVVTHLHAE